MKSIRRLNAEITLAERIYGPENVEWADDLSWIKINDFSLPSNLSLAKTDVLVFVPDNYGTMPYRDAFITPGLKVKRPSGWKSLDAMEHYFEEYPYRNRQLKFKDELVSKNWAYICIHQDKWDEASNIATFLTQIFTYLSNI